VCPAWFTTLALIVAGVPRPGGLAGLVVKNLSAKPGTKGIHPRTEAEEDQNGA